LVEVALGAAAGLLAAFPLEDDEGAPEQEGAVESLELSHMCLPFPQAHICMRIRIQNSMPEPLTCTLVPLWALVFGHIRGIPVWWRMIDAAFGVVGFLPMWLCNRWVTELEAAG
jgi:hypothetical protein